jgi:DNA-binding response OmpR family regulator
MKFQASQGTPGTNTSLQEVLVIDSDAKTTELIRAGARERGLQVRAAASIEQATLEMRAHPADLVVVNLQMGDNQGVELLVRVRELFPRVEAVALTRARNPDLCLQAWRAGAHDLLLGKIDAAEVQACLSRACQRRQQRDQAHARNQRLRGVCRSLNKARHEISQQVNLLCHDLVRAYQELAEQLNQTQVSGEFAAMIGQEVEIESLMRHTMEWLLKKLGPVNAAVYLPDSEKNYTLGAYLNFDTGADSMLVDVVAQTVIRQATESSTALLLETDGQIKDLFGNESSMLAGRSWLGCGAYYQQECLAGIVVFRGQNDPLDPTWPALIESIAPVLAEKIARSIRVYQRGLPQSDESGGESDTHDLQS